MLWVLGQLLAPCKYILIRQGPSLFKSKAVYDFILPLILCGLTIGITWSIDRPINIASLPKLVGYLKDILALLIAFYMAALAAVATFQRDGLDDLLRGGDALLKVWDNEISRWTDKKLTYREFISYLFGYLSLMSIFLFAAIIFFAFAWPIIEKKLKSLLILPDVSYLVFDAVTFFLIFFVLWQIIVTSMLGIYFLAERIQTLTRR